MNISQGNALFFEINFEIMPYNEFLADRIRNVFKAKGIQFEEKKMMGGVCYMVDDKMCAGVVKDNLMARVGPDLYPDALTHKGAREMDFTKRPMKGFVFVDPKGWDMDTDLENWIDLCLLFNPLATSSRKK
jgi:TfoX/Sxy family transcriptional regulator of competence genes